VKKLIYIIFIILCLGIVPIIPNDTVLDNGVTLVKHQSIANWVYERYQTIQAKSAEVTVNPEQEVKP